MIDSLLGPAVLAVVLRRVTMASPVIKARLAGLGVDPTSMTSTAFGKLIADETEKWGNVIRALNIKAE